MQTDLRIGTEIAGHRVLSVLGRGPRSVVYLAAQGSSSEKAALKVLAPEVGSDRAFRERFVRESRAAAALDHPNVIPIHEVGEADGVVYLTMRYVEGEDLGRLVDWWGIAPEHAVAVLSQVASALDAAHAAGLVHGNVRPANILVARAEGASWHAYLTDFGLGAAAGANLPADYVAPEQSQTEGVDGRADVYALGRVARFCLEVGRSPTRDSPEIDAVIARATAERPQNRYATAGELVGALREAITAPAARFPGAEQPPAARERRPVQPGALIGRERELGELLEGLRGAVAGRGRLFLVAGEPGVGKSRLADELASRARAQGVRVLWGRCWEAGGAPAYWPWVQLLRSCLRGQDPATVREQMGEGAMDVAQMLPEVRALIPELPPPPSVDPESARFRLFDSTAAFLRNASGEGAMALVIEDLHAADTASLLLLRFLAGQVSDSHILVLATYRDVELTPDHPLTPALSELAREPNTRHLVIAGLGEADVAKFIETAAHVAPQGQLVSMLHRETNGNPLFLGEAVRLLAAEGRLDEMADPASLRIAVPAGIRAVIGRRVDHLGETCQQALTLGSVLGPEFTSEVLRRLAELSADQLLDVVDEAVQAGLLVEVPGALGRFRFSHGLVRETLYEGLSPARRVRLHRRAGEVLEELYGSDAQPHLAELAHHFFEAARGGDAEKAADYARRAGDQAAGALAYEEAAHLYRMALQAFDTQASPDQAARGELLIGLGDAQARMGELWSARETFLSAAAIARRLGAADMLGRAVLGYGGRVTYARVGDDPHLIPLLQDALVLLGGSDDRLRVRLLTRLACALRSSPDREHPAALSQQAVDVSRRLGDPLTLGYALRGKCFATWWPENAQERFDIASEVLRIATEVDDGELMVEAHLARYAALADQGAMGQARAELAALVRIAEELRQPAQQWVGWALRCQLALLEGQYGLAEDLIPLGLEADQPATPIRDNVAAARCHLFMLRREQGRVGEVEDLIRSSMVEFPWYPLNRAALACLLLDLERIDEARTVFEDLARNDFEALYRDNEWLLGMSLASEACSLLGDAASAAILYDQLVPFAGRQAIGFGEGSVGAVDRYLGLLATTMGRLDDAERHLGEGIEMNERMGSRPWAAHTRHDLAGMLLARDGPGDRDRAAQLLGAALATARELGMIALEAKVEPLVAPTADAPAPPEPAAGRWVFRREGEYWSVAFEGDAFRLHDSKGLRYLAALLAAPGREIHALDLVGGEEGAEPERGLIGDAGEILDPQAKAAYRHRMEELREDLEEAEAWNDPERAARARQEMEFLARELAGAVGLGGRDRKAASAAERARVNVTRAIRSALGRIAEHSPSLGRHLDSTLRTGTFCSYVPDSRLPPAWHL